MKKICVFSDGTWNTIDNPKPSNIVRLATSLSLTDANGTQQLVHYDAGVGTADSDRLTGGAFGAGIDLNIQQLYTFLAFNYSPGDEVYLFGFSRGAYTVRSLAGLIHDAGLVRRASVTFVGEAYELYRSKNDAESDVAKAFRARHGGRIPIKALVCFDTVGSLGLPFEYLSDGGANVPKARYAFHDTTLNASIENAIHMLSIDEDRAVFNNTPMEPNEKIGPSQLTQRFFWGGHGDVGGSERPIIGQITLRFLLEQLEARNISLTFEPNTMPTDYPDVATYPPDPPRRRGFFNSLLRFFTGIRVRIINNVDELHETAVERYQAVESWRPQALENLKDDILSKVVSLFRNQD